MVFPQLVRVLGNLSPWKPTQSFADLDFTDSDPQHGWLVGTKETLFETKDGGKNWSPRVLQFGDEKVSFTAVSFFGDEGWVTGKPTMLLRTEDGGQKLVTHSPK